MSLVNNTPNPAPQTLNGKGEFRYKNADATELDWFDTHPRPVEEKSDETVDSGDDVPQA